MVRLQYSDHHLVVPEGEFIIGRSSQCQLCIDDKMISRAHASIVVTREQTATIEDLGSRNGVLVNGRKIFVPKPLEDGDRITIGSQTMVIRDVATTPRSADLDGDTQVGLGINAQRGGARRAPFNFDEEESSTSIRAGPSAGKPDPKVHELSLVGSVAEKALALNRPDEALRLLERPLRDVLARVSQGDKVEPIVVGCAAGLAVRLATATQRGSWLDYVFELYMKRRELLPQPIVDDLYMLLRRIRIDGASVRSYLIAIEGVAPGFGPNERFLLSRIEGLQSIVGIK